MAHGHIKSHWIFGRVTEVMCLRPNINVHSLAVERLGTRRKADWSGWLKGKSILVVQEIKALMIQMDNTRQAFLWRKVLCSTTKHG